MRIVHVSTAEEWRGGEQQALNLCKGLRTRGIESVLVTPPGAPLAIRAKNEGFSVHPFAIRGEWDLLALWRFGAFLRTLEADVVHAHDAHAVTLAAIGGWRAGVKRVATRRVDFALRGRWKYRRMDRLICISKAVRQVCAQGGISLSSMPVVYSGVDPNRFGHLDSKKAIREEFGIDRRTKIFLNVAALTDHKGQAFLLQAYQIVLLRHPDCLLLMAGDGELEEKLKSLATELAVEGKVRFLGFRDDVGALYDLCDCFVMSSKQEGLCTSVLDAMAMERAVVATRAGGLPELVVDGETGRVVPPCDVPALADAMCELIDDYKLRSRMGRAGRARLMKQFTMDAMVDGTLAVYRELLGRL